MCSAQHIQQKGQINSPQELTQHSCITLGGSAASKILNFWDVRQKVTAEVTRRYCVDHSQIRINAIKQSLGVGLLAGFITVDGVNKSNLIKVLPNWCIKHNYQGTLRLQYAQSKYISERLKLLVNHLVDNYPEFGS
ncbi:MAG: LysR substrate-binding domain-containing protein [Oceanospirillaceae bacterium]